MPELRTARLRLRDIEEADLPVLHAHNLHPLAQQFEAGPPATESQFIQIMRGVMTEQASTPRYSYYFAIERDQQVIGSCYLVVQDVDNRQAEIGYRTAYEQWGNGYATEAANALVEFGFKTLQLHRVYAEVLSDNTASCRVLEKAGMRHEGTLHETVFFNRRWWHTCIYAILEAEWQERTDQ